MTERRRPRSRSWGCSAGSGSADEAERALREAAVLLGHADQFALLPADVPGERAEVWGDLGEVVDRAVAERDAGRPPCILAAGDPGFHGMVRFAARRLGEDGIAVHPAPSSIALAAARVGTAWDDLVVASVRAQSLAEVVEAVRIASPGRRAGVAPGAARDGGHRPRRRRAAPTGGWPCAPAWPSPASEVTRTDLAGLAAGTFDPLAVVILRAPRTSRTRPSTPPTA